ncbi:MAG: NAD(P)-dependent oxidoreductase [Gammaproteobacteria bacterium]|nr:NAD(P)-dependent oxidoreductase [Gammaproteobacteria bacterium]
MRMLLIGSNGYVARALSARLQAEGVDVIGLSSQSEGGLDPVSGRPRADFKIPSGVESVIYLAQSPYYHQLPERIGHVVAVNVCAPLEIAEKARSAGVRRFVHLSSGAVYKPSFAPLDERSQVRRDALYPLTKLHAEEALRAFSGYMEINVLRLFAIYGPEQKDKLVPKLADTIAAGRTVTLAPRNADGNTDADDGGLRLSLCYVDDAARIIAHVGAHGGPELLNVAGPQALSIRELAIAIGRELGTEPLFVRTEQPRDGDLIADITCLREACNPHFTSFSEGIDYTLESARSASG